MEDQTGGGCRWPPDRRCCAGGGERVGTGRDELVDVAVTLGLGALSLTLVAGVVEGGAERIAAGAVVAAHVGPLVLRRRHPVAVVAAMATTALTSVPIGVPMVVLGPAIGVGAYSVGAGVPEAVGRRVLIGLVTAMAVVALGNGADLSTVVGNTLALALAWWLGRRSRLATEQVQQERAAAADVARQAVADERLRIARELHDVVAHAMSVIAVQAGTGRFVIGSSPGIAADALQAIEETSRQGLEELRRLLAVLRDDDAEPGARCPAPGIEELPALVAATGETGVDAQLEVRGEPVPVPPGLGLCIYRIVQEGLTNVRKHARAASVLVALGYEPAAITIEVADDGVGGEPLPGGHGLVGMRERAALYGGTVEIDAGAGFTVRARLPLEVPP